MVYRAAPECGTISSMRRLDEILEQAKRLSAEERRELLTNLEGLTDGPAVDRPAGGPYARTLAAAGSVHSDFTDVSSDKYKHVAEAALLGHGE